MHISVLKMVGINKIRAELKSTEKGFKAYSSVLGQRTSPVIYSLINYY